MESLKLRYKVGEIEFEAEGTPDAVERQRLNFMDAVLPAAVEAMVRTRGTVIKEQYLDAPAPIQALPEGNKQIEEPTLQLENDIPRISLSSFIKKYGILSEQDFTLFSAYFYEKKTGNAVFSVDDVKKYYTEARRPLPSNPSMSLYKLAEKGYIMDAPDSESKGAKQYILTDDGIAYIASYSPKEAGDEKKKATSKSHKKAGKSVSIYSNLTADDLNLISYPAVKSYSSSKEQVILAMYIVTTEGKGEWFTVADIEYLLTNIFELPTNIDMINGVFTRNKSMFKAEQDAENKKAYRRKLLSGAKDFAKLVIEGKNSQ